MTQGIAFLLLLGLAPGPETVLIASARGETRVSVRNDRGYPVIAAGGLTQALPLVTRLGARRETAAISLQGERFEFLLGAPVFRVGRRAFPLARPAYLIGDTLFLPLQWLAEYVPKVLRNRYRYDHRAARLIEISAPRPTVVEANVPASARRLGLRARHTVALDAGHGGRDPGNVGRYLPSGVREKHVNLAIAGKLQAELERRGVDVIMTRASDAFVDLDDRAASCTGSCDVFISIHVNSMPRGPRSAGPNGVETYFVGAATSRDAERVAEMENEFFRFEGVNGIGANDPLRDILEDLQANEYLRESADLAGEVQRRVAAVHPGRDRGVNQAGFWVLRQMRRPAILIETGFGTNPRDSRFLGSAEGQRKIAQAMADAVVSYLLRYERRLASTPRP